MRLLFFVISSVILFGILAEHSSSEIIPFNKVQQLSLNEKFKCSASSFANLQVHTLNTHFSICSTME